MITINNIILLLMLFGISLAVLGIGMRLYLRKTYQLNTGWQIGGILYNVGSTIVIVAFAINLIAIALVHTGALA